MKIIIETDANDAALFTRLAELEQEAEHARDERRSHDARERMEMLLGALPLVLRLLDRKRKRPTPNPCPGAPNE